MDPEIEDEIEIALRTKQIRPEVLKGLGISELEFLRLWLNRIEDELKLCECGCGNIGLVRLSITADQNAIRYDVCMNCLIALVNLSLSPKQFKSLLRRGHKDTEYLLHGDFYDNEGNALQPR